MDASKLTYKNIRNVIEKKGYEFFDCPWNLNLVGIRTSNKDVNKFDDYIVCLWDNIRAMDNIHICEATTDPGLFWLENPMHEKGTAIVKEGQYKRCWKIGVFKNLYRAFIQCNAMTVYRDFNRDDKLDIIGGTEESGIFGIDLHHAGDNPGLVNKWSAGCQVVRRQSDLAFLTTLADKQKDNGWGIFFSYTLLNEKDFIC